jgi:hypothetical protein
MRRISPFHNVAALVLCVLVAFTATRCEAESERFELRVSPTVAFAPTPLAFHVTVPRHADNRAMVIGCVSDSGEAFTSYIQLEGSSSRYAFDQVFKKVPAGEYVCAAVVVGADGTQRHGARVQMRRLMPGLGPGEQV